MDSNNEKILQSMSKEEIIDLLSKSGLSERLLSTKTSPSDGQVSNNKELGNNCFKTQEFEKANYYYSLALKDDDSNPLLYSNRAASFLKLKQYDAAIEDCTKSIALKSTIKALLRRATAFVETKRFVDAFKDYKDALLNFEPHNKECREGLDTVLPILMSSHHGYATEALLLLSNFQWVSGKFSGNPKPPALYGHQQVLVTNELNEEHIFVVGGRSVMNNSCSIFCYDIMNQCWDTHKIIDNGINIGCWTSAVYSQRNKSLYIFGGVSSHGEESNLLIYNALTKDCRVGCNSSVGSNPPGRSGHTAILLDDKTMMVFGGRTRNGVSNDMYKCIIKNDETCKWELIPKNGDWPSARDGHSMCAFRDELIVYGGNDQLAANKKSDVAIFNLHSSKWSFPVTSGQIPDARSFHTANIVENFMFVVGGRTEFGEDSSVYLLNLDTYIWDKAIPTGSNFTPRAWHSSCVGSDNKLYIYGGGSSTGPLKDIMILHLNQFIEQNKKAHQLQ